MPRSMHAWSAVAVAVAMVFVEQYVADGFSGSLGAPRQVSGGLRVSF